MTVPSVLLVPGAWHRPDHFRLLVDELSDVDVHTVTLTSSGDDPAALQDMHADAGVIARAAAAIGGPVVVVAHSYGGVPTTQAFRQAGNVARIIFLAAFQLLAGESLLSINCGSLMPWARRRRQKGIGDYVEVVTPMTVFYNDVEAETARYAVARLGYQSYASMSQRLTETAWQTIPSTYVICEADNAIPVAAQEAMARRADDVVRLPTSHSPFLSQSAMLAGLIRRSLARA
ncbi:alpha/beta hydrolase [Mycolicibacterium stellerae]|uniref:alpha/beta hydrolase n=1 Tax=Mycolicibacterium stellerae TaxID=2358193 RepID=UPI000F0B4E21|nr:alpha/beta hydrolase [Mycolicibacterium stellerae]